MFNNKPPLEKMPTSKLARKLVFPETDPAPLFPQGIPSPAELLLLPKKAIDEALSGFNLETLLARPQQRTKKDSEGPARGPDGAGAAVGDDEFVLQPPQKKRTRQVSRPQRHSTGAGGRRNPAPEPPSDANDTEGSPLVRDVARHRWRLAESDAKPKRHAEEENQALLHHRVEGGGDQGHREPRGHGGRPSEHRLDGSQNRVGKLQRPGAGSKAASIAQILVPGHLRCSGLLQTRF
jgi:hypothetical protein